MLFKPGLPIEETTEAALALGDSAAATVAGILIQAYPKAASEELAQCILLGLAKRPFSQSEPFFRQMLANPLESSYRKKEALEALGQFDSVRDQFFLPFVESPDVEVRRGAYQGLGKLREGQPGVRLMESLQKEQDEAARADLYEVLSLKEVGNPALLNELAMAEKDPAIRLMAGRAVAQSLQSLDARDPRVVAFERTWVPELTERALGGGTSLGVQAVFGLMAAQRLESARLALTRVAENAPEPKVRGVARNALTQFSVSP
jgi:hypothetical protein